VALGAIPPVRLPSKITGRLAPFRYKMLHRVARQCDIKS
jgi:hypothetical protein